MMAPAMRARAAGVLTTGGAAFGSYWRLTLPEWADVANVTQEIEALVRAVDESMSPYRASSELCRFNRARTTDPVAMSDALYGLISRSVEIAARTGGAFDPTVGPIVGRFGFGPILDGSLSASFHDLATGEGSVRKGVPDLTVDLCGIAKGYALDRIADALSTRGEENLLLEIGGEVMARGVHPSGRPWQVGVERPHEPATTLAHVVRPNGLALATSGPAVQSYAVGDRTYSHVVDPRLRGPADGSIASVTVLMATGIDADAHATALVAMGTDAALDFAERQSIPALFQIWVAGGLEERTSADFADFIVS